MGSRRALLIGLLPVFTGAVLYWLFCPDVLFVQWVDSFFGIERGRTAASLSGGLRFFRNYGFDFLWALSMAGAAAFFLGAAPLSGILAAAMPVIVGAAAELFQFFRLAPGTFDVWDMAAEAAGALTGVFALKVPRKAADSKKEEE